MKLRFRPIPVTRDKVSTVITASENIVNQQIKERGANTQLLVDHEGKQAFKNIVNHSGIAVRFVLSESLYSQLESEDMSWESSLNESRQICLTTYAVAA